MDSSREREAPEHSLLAQLREALSKGDVSTLLLIWWVVLFGCARLFDAAAWGLESLYYRVGRRSSEEALVQTVSRRTPQHLIPVLPDDLVRVEVWRHIPRMPPMLWVLRRVSVEWRDFVSSSLEWAALETIRVDRHYLRRVQTLGGRRQSLYEVFAAQLELLEDPASPKSCPRFLNQEISLAPSARDLYSASVELQATIDCFHQHHVTGQVPR
ncbi:hypothetical protein R1sor_009448 [Riccia sorocarpa]|uniref:F-box domain-containing protein n=1 Tax=Riccia sorocarpa TaxID=122646 RepID=A0ABD3HV43_9MARC